jgi:hypothetical protein
LNFLLLLFSQSQLGVQILKLPLVVLPDLLQLRSEVLLELSLLLLGLLEGLAGALFLG